LYPRYWLASPEPQSLSTHVGLENEMNMVPGATTPDGSRCNTPGNVLIWSSEDDLTRTIVPRLIAACADLNRIVSVDGTVDERGLNVPFDPSLHMDDLRQQVRQVPGGVSLLIIDPIVSAVSGDTCTGQTMCDGAYSPS
jgi:putative DNA primase/helicase